MAAVFFDIDGTLWDKDYVIPDSATRAIQLLLQNGHHSFLCTGRPRVTVIGKELFDLDMEGILAGCGTYIELGGKVLFNRELDQKLLRDSVDLLNHFDLPVLLEGKDALFMAEGIREDVYGQYLLHALPDKIYPLEGTRDYWRAGKMTVLIAGREYKEAISLLRPSFELLQHGTHSIELVPRGFSKSSGIRRICGLLGIPHEETYAFGDGVNDCDMLSFVSCGIAMGNAARAAKDAADYVTSDIHQDGILNALGHFGLI